MKTLMKQLRWEFLILHKNSIINISLGVTIIYAIILFLLRDIAGLDTLVVALVLNDPSVIGYFFIGLAIYTEIKHQILPAIFTTPAKIHIYILSKTISLTLIGGICSIGLVMSVKGLNFDILIFIVGATGICVLSTLLGLIMLTLVDEFLKFAMISIPIFLGFVNIPLLQYLGIIELSHFKYIFPIQGSLDLINYGVSNTKISIWASLLSLVIFIPLFYWLAYRQFSKHIVHQ